MRKTIRKLKGKIRGKDHSSHTTDRQAKILRETDLRVLGPLCRYDSNLSGSKIGDLVRISQVRTGEGDGDGNERWEGKIGEYTSIKMGAYQRKAVAHASDLEDDIPEAATASGTKASDKQPAKPVA